MPPTKQSLWTRRGGGDQALSVVQIESVADGKRLAEDERVGVILKSFII